MEFDPRVTGAPADRHRAAAEVSLPVGATIPAAFAAQVRRHPDRPAVLAADGRVTYRQLAASVAAVAAALRVVAPRAPGSPPGRIGVLCRHGASTVTGILGALAAGHAYVPLDPAFPAGRLADLLRDSGAAGIVTDTDHAARAAELAAGLPVTVVRECDPVDDPFDGLAGPSTMDDPAYLLYTSGSTGRPKGVVQSHRNVLFGVTNHATNFRITPDDRTSVLTSFGFDMAVTDTFSALLTGAAAVPVDVRAVGLAGVVAAIAEHGVTIYHSTPTVYRYLIAALAETRLTSVRA
ncbi:AMP-binding protein, partial [Virgisporangium aurantiacum]|uniref:AMP-binding protein n=1 Tax=Virgisporangium aurantiacum TaxID=175570 RepID=UPI001951FBCA